MKEIIKEVEFISMKMKEIKDKYNLKENDTANSCYWHWYYKRFGMIRVCQMLGIALEVTDLEGLKWGIKVAE